MFHSSVRSLLCLCSLMIAGARQVWLLHAKILSRVSMVFSGRGVPGKIPLVYLAVFAAAWQWGALPGDKVPGTAFADPVVHVLSGPGEQLIIENDGKVHLAYGTTGNNLVTVESGARAHLRHFPGENIIHIVAEMAQCVAVRSGAMVTISNPNDGTLMKIPATNEKQTLQFASYSKILQIIGGKVKLGDLEIGLDAQPIVQGPPPVITSTIPANGAENVGVSTSIAIHFSKHMWGASLMPDCFILKKLSDPSEEPILCTMTIESTSVILTPIDTLAFNTEYQLTVTTWVRDTSGNHLEEEKVVTFTTRGIPPVSYETIPPVVQSTIPANGQTGVDVDNPITIVFSEQMAWNTLIPENFVLEKKRWLMNGYQPVPFTLTPGLLGTSATLTPNGPLAYHKKHRLKVKTGVQDKVGNPMEEEYVITFTTVDDTTPPFVVSSTPAHGAEGVGVNNLVITIQFNEPMDQSTLIPKKFILFQQTPLSSHLEVYDSLPSSVYTMTKTPTSVTLTLNKPLFYDTKYRLDFCSLKDASGNYITSNTSIAFTTVKPQPGDETTIDLGDGVGMTFVWVPAGGFLMGSLHSEPHSQRHERPRHFVTLTQGFWMGKYEVTQEQWLHLMGNNPSHFQGGNRPVEMVSWNDVQGFIAELNYYRGETTFSLPTEAQWEYAARGGVPDHIYSGGNNANQVGWHYFNSGRKTHEVGEKPSNAWGLHDMSGNVWEWCQDWYDRKYYVHCSCVDPTGPGSGVKRLVRGGSWGGYQWYMRPAFRACFTPNSHFMDVGFRLVMHLP